MTVPHAVQQVEGFGVLGRRECKTRSHGQDGKGKSHSHGEGSCSNTQNRGIEASFPLLPGRIDGTLQLALVGQLSFQF